MNEVEPGVLIILISGLNGNEITTFNPSDPQEQENPFLLGELYFQVIGDSEETTALEWADVAMADTDAAEISDVNSQDATFEVE